MIARMRLNDCAEKYDLAVRERDEARAACDDFHYRYTEKLCQVAKLLNERDEARAFASRLWAATQALLGQRDEYLQLAYGFRDVCQRSVKNTDMAIEQRNEAQAEAERFLDQRNEARADVKHLRQRQAQIAAEARCAALEEAAAVCEKSAEINRDVVESFVRSDTVVAGGITETSVRTASALEAESLARRIRALIDADAPTPEADNG